VSTELSMEELDQQHASVLPRREEMLVVCANLCAYVNVGGCGGLTVSATANVFAHL